jgi:hypothetical protein
MINFCTLFDSNYLSRGLAMYQSLVETGDDFHLYIFCFDSKSLSLLERLALPFITTVSLLDFENDELLRVKAGRTRAEYCWTCASHTIAYALKTYDLESVTYIDADLYFYASPSTLLKEFYRSGASILLSRHNFSPRYAHLVKLGIYCVQFMTFKSDPCGLAALRWWQDRCIEWCYDRFEPNRFGDQKYLDDWTERFEGVSVLPDPGDGIAPWNVQKYDIAYKDGALSGTVKQTGKQFAIVFYHFHHVRFYHDGGVELGHYRLNDSVRRELYFPYFMQLQKAAELIRTIDVSFDPHGRTIPSSAPKKILGRLYRRLQGNFITMPNMEAY